MDSYDKSSVDTSNSSKEYRSNYSCDLDLDKTYKNALLNYENEEDILFNMKNAIFINYGEEIYKDILNLYNLKIKEFAIDKFDIDLWNKCLEIHSHVQDTEIKFCCCNLLFKTPINNKSVKDMYHNLVQMKWKYEKIKQYTLISNMYIESRLRNPIQN